MGNTTPAIIVNIQRQPGTNIIGVVDTVQALLPQIKASLPEGVDMQVVTDRTTTIRASVEDVEFELMLTIALVVMVIFLFLRSLVGDHHSRHRGAAFADRHVRRHVPAGIQPRQPLADGVHDFDRFRGGRRDRDDREHLRVIMEMGDTPMEAAFKGSAEIGFTIVSLTVSLIAVLIPLLFMADIVGRLFREFAVTLAVTIIFSAFVSLTLTPMMAARILKHKPEHEQGRFYRWSEWVSSRPSSSTERWCGWYCAISRLRCWWRWGRWHSRCICTSSFPKDFSRSRIRA